MQGVGAHSTAHMHLNYCALVHGLIALNGDLQLLCSDGVEDLPVPTFTFVYVIIIILRFGIQCSINTLFLNIKLDTNNSDVKTSTA